MKSYNITQIGHSVMMALSKHKFIVLSQLLQLEIGTTNYQTLYRHVIYLRDRKRPLIGRSQFSQTDRFGKMKDLYYLTKYGAMYVAQQLNVDECDIDFPKSKPRVFSTYRHRFWVVDFNIKLSLSAPLYGYYLKYFHAYYHKQQLPSVKLRSASTIKTKSGASVIPDAIFLLEAHGFERLFFLEVHRGFDTKRILDQLSVHATALRNRTFYDQLQYSRQRAYYVLTVFEHQSTMDALLRRVQKGGGNTRGLERYFLCTSIDALNESGIDEWVNLFAELVLFQNTLVSKKSGSKMLSP